MASNNVADDHGIDSSYYSPRNSLKHTLNGFVDRGTHFEFLCASSVFFRLTYQYIKHGG